MEYETEGGRILNQSILDRSLSPTEAKMVKKMLWEGDNQSVIAGFMSITQARVSRISLGRLEADIEWPNGSVGPMDSERRVLITSQKRRNARRMGLGLPQRELEL